MPKIGDLFKIKISEKSFFRGQVLAKRRPIYYMSLIDGEFTDSVSLSGLAKRPILFLGNFFDIKLKNGDWPIIGNSKPALEKIPFPCYTVKIGDDFYVEDWAGERHRKATPEEILTLDFPTNFSAASLENAARAIHGASNGKAILRNCASLTSCKGLGYLALNFNPLI